MMAQGEMRASGQAIGECRQRCGGAGIAPRRRRWRGITLVELMVVVAVVAILATVAYPLYTRQVQKSRRTDAKSALMQLAQAQERWYTANGQFIIATAALGAFDLPAPIQTGNSEGGYYTITLAAGVTGDNGSYTATATPVAGKSQAGDTCGTYTVDNRGVQTPAVPAYCW